MPSTVIRSMGLALGLLIASCEAAPIAGASCALTSECPSHLVCRLGRCRSACALDRDCPVGATCLLDTAGEGTCGVDADLGCESGVGRTCPSPLVCFADRCIASCHDAGECPADGACAPVTGTSLSVCIDPRSPPPDAGASDASTLDAAVARDAATSPDAATPQDVAMSQDAGVCADGTCLRVFVTAAGVLSAGFGSVIAADSVCQNAADAQTLGGTWRAWISDATSSPSGTGWTHATIPYRLLDGHTVASNWNELTSGTIAHPIDITESVTPVVGSPEVWTGTTESGAPSGSNCSSWAGSTGADPPATVGIVGPTDPEWSNAYVQFCDHAGRLLYCFEQ